MCLIIYRPAGAAEKVSRKTLRHCAMENPDGFGLMWVYDGKLCIARYLWPKLETFIARTLSLQEQNIPFVAHFRWATHGDKTRLDNVHPFWIEQNESALMHNGIFNIACVKDWSDTRTFTHRVLNQLPANWPTVPHLRWIVDEATTGSKLVIMNREGIVTIIHEKAGVWDGGIWYSNSGYRESKWDTWPDYEWTDAERLVLTASGFHTATPALAGSVATGSRIDPSIVALEAEKLRKAEGKALQARLAWEESRGTHLTGATDGAVYYFPPPHVAETSLLYMFEGMAVCEACKRMEATAAHLTPLSGVEVGDSCDLCHMPGTPTLIAAS